MPPRRYRPRRGPRPQRKRTGAAGAALLEAQAPVRPAGPIELPSSITVKDFAPARTGKPVTSLDRVGSFKRTVGYEGWTKSMYEQVWFDSSTERDLANVLDDTQNVSVWARLHIRDLEIRWDGGSYNPDFVAAQNGTRWVIETKADRDLASEDVQAKRKAAQRWANHISDDERVGERWNYLLVGESDLRQAKDDWGALLGTAGF